MRRSRRARRGAPAAEDYTANQPPDVLDRVVVHAVGTAIDGILRALVDTPRDVLTGLTQGGTRPPTQVDGFSCHCHVCGHA